MQAKWRGLLTATVLTATLVAPSAHAQWRDPGRDPGRGYGGRGYVERGYGGAPGARGVYGSPAYGAPGGGNGWRRGQVLPPGRRDAYVADPGRYHLRAPPPGYGWVGDGRNAYLTQRSTGMVLDSVPGAYEPAPAYRGRRRR